MKKGRNIGLKISKYIVSGVLLFSMFSVSACKKDKVTQEQISELSKQIEDLKEQVASVQALNDELSAQLTSAQSLNEQLNALNEQLNALNEQLNGQIEDKDININELTEQVQALSASVDTLNSQIESLNEQISSLDGDKTALQQQLAALQQQKDQADQTIAQLNQTIAELQQQIENLEKVTVTFNTNGGSAIASVTLAKDSLLTKPKDPTKKGYTFIKWVYGDLEVDWNFDTDLVQGDITLKAIWSANTYTITYKLNGGSFTGEAQTSVVYDTNYTLPGVKKTNYTLSRWTRNGATFKSGKWTIAANTTLECEWALTNATITYIYGYDKPNEVQNVKYNTNFTLQEPERTGYTFLGWNYNGSYISSGKWTYLDSIEVTAEWAANTYNLTLDPGEGTFDGDTSFIVTYDEGYTLPVCEPLNEKRPFAGWFIGDVRVTDQNGESLVPWTITSDQELNAKYFTPIATKDDFFAINDDIEGIYSLVNDVDFEGVEFEPLDNFKGTLWGLGYAIKGVYFESDITSVGLFKQINGATIENINFTDSVVNVTGASSSTYFMGMVASQAYGTNTFRNVTTNNITYNINLSSGTATVGGLVGVAENLVIDNVSIGGLLEVKSTGNSVNLGGVVGQSVGNIEASGYSLVGHVKGTSAGGTKEALVGGLVGSSYTLDLTDCVNNGTAQADSLNKDVAYAGGIVGKITERTVFTECYNSANVVSSKYGGGLIGYHAVPSTYLDLVSSTNNGTVSDGGDAGILGGLIGRCKENVYLNGLFNNGNVETTNGYAGGLVGTGDLSVTFDSCYNIGSIKGTNGSAGGFIGLASTTRIQDSYTLGVVSAQVYAGGFVGEATTKVESYKSFVGGEVKLVDSSSDGFVGGFAGRAVNSEVGNCFVIATLRGIDGKTNSYVGKADGCSATNVPSAATLKDMSGNDITESSYPVVTSVSIDTITAEYIASSLQFDATKWTIEFDYENNVYPTLKYFEV